MNVNTAANSKVTRMCRKCFENFKRPQGVKVVESKNCTPCRIATDWRTSDQKKNEVSKMSIVKSGEIKPHTISNTVTPDDLRRWQRESFRTFAEQLGAIRKTICSNCVGRWRVTINGEVMYEGTEAAFAIAAYDAGGADA